MSLNFARILAVASLAGTAAKRMKGGTDAS